MRVENDGDAVKLSGRVLAGVFARPGEDMYMYLYTSKGRVVVEV
jgi:hypothetical protein